ncbi:uncharacterized protein LOC100877339 isoform X3 [Megachile rotundata]|uniref:uncharacterized protein LOC100877339 isoform X3 n=1 Tax=Megachile rotundata TaxID=143995 RepID=UPI0006150E7F|nr:PREDICTED: uncharacterized protein LOC100877339 isoform X2 [Megachile rotundata]
MRADRGPENGMGLFFYNFGGDQLHRFTRLYLQRLQKQLPPDVAFPCNVTDNKLSNTTLEVLSLLIWNINAPLRKKRRLNLLSTSESDETEDVNL